MNYRSSTHNDDKSYTIWAKVGNRKQPSNHDFTHARFLIEFSRGSCYIKSLFG